ncbi:MAG: O-antigen ligase family protein [Candidatus Hodarchaeota archaeon]
MAQLFKLDFRNKLILLIFSLLLVTGCRDWAVDPEVRFGLIMLIAIVSFITIFTKPIIGVYAVAIISTAFSPPINIGFANLYFHQWVILIALLASISSGLILQNFHTNIKSELNLPMIVFIGSLLLSMSHAPHMVTGIKSFLYVGVLVASYYLVLLCVNSEKQIKMFIGLLVIATSVVCLISLQYHSSGRLGSLVLRNPNSFGNFLALVIPFSLSLVVFGRFERGKKSLIACSLILTFISLVFTFSRSAWFGVFVSISCLCVLKPRASVFLLIFVIISGVFLFSPIKKRVFKDISDPGAQYRVIKAKIALNKFKENPLLGSGLGSFHYEAQFSEVWAYRAHSTLENNYLVLLAEGGLIEFFAFLYLIIALGKKVLSLLKRIRDPFLHPVLLGCITSIVSTLAAGMFEDTLFFPKNNWLIGIFMGIIVVVERIYRESLTTAETTEVEVEGKERILTNGHSLEP